MNKTALILSFTPITGEPRVLRQNQALFEAGWDVILAGFKGSSPPPANAKLITFANSQTQPPLIEMGMGEKQAAISSQAKAGTTQSLSVKRLYDRTIVKLPPYVRTAIRAVLKIAYRLPLISRIYLLLLARKSDDAAIKYFWKSGYYRFIFPHIEKNLDALGEKGVPSLIIAHDYFAAPIAEKLSQKFKVPFVVDIHEYAKGQYMHSRVWRLFYRPWVDRMQKIFLFKSAYNTTVCEGIANLLEQDYAPLKKPTVIRSTPFYTSVPYNPVGEKINVLYHGIIYPSRGLELAVESLRLWRPEFNLILRGPGSSDYFDYLKRKGANLGVGDRLTIEEPVLFNEIIPAANKADIGYFVHEDISPQKRFTLPNKFFEYIMAGLALCVSDLPEMSRITNQYDLGKLVKGYDALQVAAVINSFDRDSINRYKQNSLNAAKELCWENESRVLVSAYEDLTGGGVRVISPDEIRHHG